MEFIAQAASTRSSLLSSHADNNQRRRVSVILTVKNDAAGCAQTLESLAAQTRCPDEIVVVDGGSTDDTRKSILAFAPRLPGLRLIDAPGVNIAEGRDLATRCAAGPIIACIDAGCRAAPDWLQKLVEPFEHDSAVEVVAGMYEVDHYTLFEEVVGLATMRGQLSPVDPKTFNPSGRSMAYTTDVWKRAGGWPTWLRFSEDTLFDHRLRRVAAGWRFAGDAVVYWRPRTNFRTLAKQFYCYGTGRGQTQIGANDFLYNIRNILLIALAVSWSMLTPWLISIALGLFVYFFVWAFHGKALQIARRTGRMRAYPLTLVVMWVAMLCNLAGYLRGSWQRFRDGERFRRRMETYLLA